MKVVLYSGGPDSFITLVRAMQDGGEVLPVYFKLGHRYQKWELEAIENTFPVTTLHEELEGLGQFEEQDAFLPSRNAYLVLAAAQLFHERQQDGEILLTVQKDELQLADRSPLFLDVMTVVVSHLTGLRIQVRTPWLYDDKTDMVKWYLANGHPVERLQATHSCYKPQMLGGAARENLGLVEYMPCGNCSACIRRYVAFKLNGIHEDYYTNPVRSPRGMKYRARAVGGHYSKSRCDRILAAMRG